MEMCLKNSFKVTLRLTEAIKAHKGDQEYVEETYSLSIKRKNDLKATIWILTIERYESFKVIVLSFYQKKHSKAKGIKRFKRNHGDECFDALIVLQLFRECIKLCRNSQNESYSFCFYALDDEFVKDDQAREDMNRRMAVFTKFLERNEDLKNHVLENIGNIQDSIYLGYDPKICSQQNMIDFITFYRPILKKDIQELFAKQESKKF